MACGASVSLKVMYLDESGDHNLTVLLSPLSVASCLANRSRRTSASLSQSSGAAEGRIGDRDWWCYPPSSSQRHN